MPIIHALDRSFRFAKLISKHNNITTMNKIFGASTSMTMSSEEMMASALLHKIRAAHNNAEESSNKAAAAHVSSPAMTTQLAAFNTGFYPSMASLFPPLYTLSPGVVSIASML
jgi:hypothetical protein